MRAPSAGISTCRAPRPAASPAGFAPSTSPRAISISASRTRTGTTRRRCPSRSNGSRRSTSRSTWRRSRCASNEPAAGRSAAAPPTSPPRCKAKKFAAVLHMEGCEAIDADLAALETFYAAGLRSLGPVWSRNNIFGHGVPFAYPMSPDTGPGLTDAGKRLVKACNRLGIMIDLAHITEKGFWDVAKLSDQPLVVSHSNAHAHHAGRAQPDRQAARRGARKQGAGRAELRRRHAAGPTAREDADTPLSDMVRHIDYLVEQAGHRRRGDRIGLRRRDGAGRNRRRGRPAEARCRLAKRRIW